MSKQLLQSVTLSAIVHVAAAHTRSRPSCQPDKHCRTCPQPASALHPAHIWTCQLCSTTSPHSVQSHTDTTTHTLYVSLQRIHFDYKDISVGAGNLAVLERAVDELARRYSMEWQVRAGSLLRQQRPAKRRCYYCWLSPSPVAVSLALSPSSRQDFRLMTLWLHTPAHTTTHQQRT